MPNPIISYKPMNMYERKPWLRVEISGLIRAQGLEWATRAKIINGWHRSSDGRNHCTVEYGSAGGRGRVGHIARPDDVRRRHLPRATESTTCAGATAETDATAGPPADNDATPVTSVDNGPVRVHARVCRALECLPHELAASSLARFQVERAEHLLELAVYRPHVVDLTGVDVVDLTGEVETVDLTGEGAGS
ncbi:MAG: hypothetical protein M1826_006575 [Phylliscum demangeonii]|nr:MAG: hypothetical protein M1826_006575 [Phylliscum demangeonii]